MNEKYTENIDNFREFKLNPSLSKWSMAEKEVTEDQKHVHDGGKRFSYCYLCSIGAHEHTKTEPVPIDKRRYLRPYLNPVQLIKKYEKNLHDLELKTKYKFLVKTGSGLNSGTNATVMFKLFGTAGTWEQTELKPKNSNGIKFPTNSIVEIELNGPILGELRKLKIWHNGKSVHDGWYVDFVEIVCYSQKQTWRFVCDQWLSIHRPPSYSSTAVLSLNNIFNSEKTKHLTDYFFMIKTSDIPLSGKDVNVQFQFVGSKHNSQVFNFLTPYVNLFESNQLDCFMITCSNDLGAPEKLILVHNSSKMAHNWSIEFIKCFYSKQPDRIFTFKVDKWLEKNNHSRAVISLYENVIMHHDKSLLKSKKIYHISVKTGNLKNAGTDSRVYIEIKGSNGVTRQHRLHNSKAKREFERGQIDHFYIVDEDVGKLEMIRIGHDNSGRSPQWYLDAVLIRSVSTTISGEESTHDIELFDHLDKIRTKIRIKDLKPEDLDKLNQTKSRRAKSAELGRTQRMIPAKRSRSISASLKKQRNSHSKNVDGEEIIEPNESSSTVSILKTSASPRTRRDMMKKHVKFDKNLSESKNSEAKKSEKTKIEMSINWLMSVTYSNNSQVSNVRTLENFDKSIKAIDKRYVKVYQSKLAKSTQSVEQFKSLANKCESVSENVIHVFECNKWLDANGEERKTEKILKLSEVL